MDIIITNTSEVPIYEQIEEQIKGLILTGRLTAGEALPSSRPVPSADSSAPAFPPGADRFPVRNCVPCRFLL